MFFFQMHWRRTLDPKAWKKKNCRSALWGLEADATGLRTRSIKDEGFRESEQKPTGVCALHRWWRKLMILYASMCCILNIFYIKGVFSTWLICAAIDYICMYIDNYIYRAYMYDRYNRNRLEAIKTIVRRGW